MKSRYIFVLVLGLCLAVPAALLASGSQASSEEPIKLSMSWWGGEARHTATIAAIELWNSKHPGITMEYAYSGWAGYHDKLTTQFAGRVAPDVIQISRNVVGEYAHSGVLENLTKYVPTHFADIDEGLWQWGRVDDEIYAVAAGTSCGGLIYNKQRFIDFGLREPSDHETWDSFLELCKQVTRDMDGDGTIDVWGIFNLFEMTLENWRCLLHQYGVELWPEDMQKSNFDDPRVLEAWLMIKEFIDAGVCPPPGEVTVPEGMSWVNSGICACRIGALAQFAAHQAIADFEMSCTLMPRRTVDGPSGTGFGPPMVFAISSETDHFKEALEFLSWFMTDVEAAKVTGMVRGMYPSAKLRTEMEQYMTPEDVKVSRAMNVAAAEGISYRDDSPENWSEWNDIYKVEAEKLAYGEVDVEGFIENVINNADPVLHE